MPRTTQRSAARSSSNASHRVRIRMYRQGLGDCFLLSFPGNRGKQFHLMIDCGVVLGTGDPAVVMKKIAEDVRVETGGKLDVLVITHEHWDHLSGFDGAQARAIFEKIAIGELWLAWTEDERDSLANQLREERERKKEAAKAAREEAKKRGLTGQASRLEQLMGLFGAAGAAASEDDEGTGGGGTAGALAFLKSKRPPTILQTGDTITMPGAEGVRVYVMGPPKDAVAIRKTNPRKGEGYGFADGAMSLADAFLAAINPGDESAHPFPPALRLPLEELKSESTRAQRPGLASYYHTEMEWRNIDNAWLSTGERLALQLDNATNNTSLVLAFELEGKDVLLFVGDAQAGNWRSWDGRRWRYREPSGEIRKVTSADLLKRTVFYKVGHHGSHNATLRANGLELMVSDRLAAVIPVDTGVAHDVKGWRHMPLPAIRERLKEKCAVIFQSDLQPEEIRKVPGTRWKASAKKFDVRMRNRQTKKMQTVRKENLYIDYFV